MKRYTFFVSTILIFSFSLVAQNNLLFYNFDAVNQNLMINPSDQHDYRLVVGIPGISGISAHYTNTVFKAGEFFNDKDLTENLDNIIPNLDGNERINFYENIDLLYVGLGLKKGFLSFGIQQEATLNMVMPAKLLQFIYYGNADQENINFSTSSFNAEALIQVNYHVGYQHWLLDSALSVGGRFKYISGTGHGHFKNFNASIQSDIFEWTIDTDILLETSGYQYIDDFSGLNPFQMFNSGNPGWAIDLGATYIIPKMTFSLSALNIGSITWKKDIKNYQSLGSFTYQGIEIDEGNQEGDFDAILDSLEKQLGFKELTPYSYKSKLPMHLMASYEYHLTDKHSFALTYQGTNWNSKMYNNLGVSYIGRLTKRFDATVGYSRLAGGLNNIGLGLSAAAGPVQLYLLCDNAWGLYKPTELSATNVRFGINLVFYDKSLSKKKKNKEEEQQNPITQ